MRQALTTLLEIAGLTALTVGAYLTAPALGWATGGLSLVLVGYLAGER